MCTMLVRQEKIAGSGKGTKGWFALRVTPTKPKRCSTDNSSTDWPVCRRIP